MIDIAAIDLEAVLGWTLLALMFIWAIIYAKA